ncbi:Fc.00g052650.m01.CDS01 [Cosmosporella sp. VM-42]
MADMESLSKPLGLTYTSRQYGEHSLQKLGIWQFTDSPDPTSGRWIIFIHGGGWRDPRNTSDDFWPSIKHLLSSGRDKSDFRGFISIDYRLSPHPQFPQNLDKTPGPELRNARHPDHIQDIFLALKFLQDEFQLSNDYVLVGHSAGATLAFQVLMGDAALEGQSHPRAPLPAAIIGISGIYDLVNLNARFDGQYASFIGGSFGDDQSVWEKASPRRFSGSFKKIWPGKGIIKLAWSSEDTLIDEAEIDDMGARLKKDGVPFQATKKLKGEHDFVWEDGSQICPLVLDTLDILLLHD